MDKYTYQIHANVVRSCTKELCYLSEKPVDDVEANVAMQDCIDDIFRAVDFLEEEIASLRSEINRMKDPYGYDPHP